MKLTVMKVPDKDHQSHDSGTLWMQQQSQSLLLSIIAIKQTTARLHHHWFRHQQIFTLWKGLRHCFGNDVQIIYETRQNSLLRLKRELNPTSACFHPLPPFTLFPHSKRKLTTDAGNDPHTEFPNLHRDRQLSFIFCFSFLSLFVWGFFSPF